VERRVGTAGWTIPADVRERFASSGSQLERYANVFSCVEINSSFYRPHRSSTYGRWARCVPGDFRFSLKVPKTITHERRFADCENLLADFLEATSALGVKRDVLLVQLPPTFAFDERMVTPFFSMFRERYSGRIACEPRHGTWFTPAGDALFDTFAVARVAADPVVPGGLAGPGGSPAFHYTRLHGSPHVYYSSYEPDALAEIAATLRSATVPQWCIFDNTARGAAAADALTVRELVKQVCSTAIPTAL
jgi:uncharacterized protein YecE (DUF72 family)